MKYLKMLSHAALMALMLMTFAGMGTASATTLETAGTAKNQSVSITMSLKSGTSTAMRDTWGFLHSTCSLAHLAAGTESPYTGTTVGGPVSEWGFWPCDGSTTVQKVGQLSFEHISGTTNAQVYLEAELRVYSTMMAEYIDCKTSTGTPIGTLTGVASGHATLDVNTVIDCGENFLSSTKWTGTYTVTSPTGLGVSS